MEEHNTARQNTSAPNTPAEKIVATIKREHIEPEPHWKYAIKNGAFWGILIAMILLGSLFLAVFLSNVFDLGPDIFRTFQFGRFLSLLILTSPLFWIVFAAIAIVSGVLAFRRTRYGYRWSTISLASFFILTLALVAFGSHISQIDERFEQSWAHTMRRFGDPFSPPREHRWLQPESGLLIGNITETKPEQFFLDTQTGELWLVSINAETRIARSVVLSVGSSVVVLGEPENNHTFRALLIRPFRNNRFFPEYRNMNDSNHL